jgi:hypothetical protein
MLRNILLLTMLSAVLTLLPRASAAYRFEEGYNVLDTNNFPGVGTNFGGTSGLERDIAVDASRGIIYIARGNSVTNDGRNAIGIAAIVVTNGARAGSNFRDTGLITSPNGWCQSLAFDPASDKLWVLGGPIGANPIIYTAPGGTLGGAPNGNGQNSPNPALVQAFQVSNNLPDGFAPHNRVGQPRGFAVRTVGSTTTVYLGMGNHVEAWSNDTTNSAFRRIWATLRPPAGNLVSTRVATNFTGVNGVAVDDAGNCYFNVLQGRLWCVRPEFVAGVPDPMALDFNDLVLGGSNEREIMALVVGVSPGVSNVSNPQGLTFARFGSQKTLFVSYIPGLAQRAVMRVNVDNNVSISNGGFYLPALAVDSFGSGQSPGGQDSILSSLRLRQAAAGQPQAGALNGTLYHDVDSVTNPTFIYFQGFVIDTNKGQTIPTAATVKVRLVSDETPPAIVTQPANQTLLEGGTLTVSVGASGMLPLHFQWQSNSVDIPDATNAFYSLTPATTNESGIYRVVITNLLGSVMSTTAVVTVNPLVRSEAMTTPAWSLAPGSRPYLTTDNGQRGLAFNPATENLLLATRTPSNAVIALSPGDGSEQYVLGNDPSIINGGTLALNVVGASEDGQIYAANVAQNADSFRIYNWASDEAGFPPTLAFSSSPTSLGATRYGDTFDVRGQAGDNSLQILAGSRQGTNVVIFTTANGGSTLLSTVIKVPDAVSGAFGLSVSFGQGNTFWAKGDSETALRLVQFDLANGTGTVLRTFGSASYPLGATIMAVNTNLNVLAAVSLQNPDNLRLYDIGNLAGGPRLVDQELFATDNDNLFGTGAVDFGAGRVYALDSNNGLVAYTLGAIPPPPVLARINILRDGGSVTLTWDGNYILQSTTNLPVGTNFTDVVGATNGHTEAVNSALQKYFRLRN